MCNFFSKNWISVLSLIISLITFTMNYYRSRPHLRIRDKKINDSTTTPDEFKEYNLLINCRIDNRSINPITIINVKLNGKSCFPSKINLGGCGIKYLGQKVTVEQISSFQFPIKINPYDTEIGSLFFKTPKPMKLRKINILMFYTSRGIKIRILFYSKRVKN